MKANKAELLNSFGWLNVTQFLGALNDNIFKLLTILFIIGALGDDKASNVTALAGAVFVVPFLLVLPYAGRLADRLSKRDIVVWTKLSEVAVMLAGVGAFLLASVWALYAVLFMMATQSAFFGPSKYGIIPELVGNDEITRANSFIDALTYLAIVIGTALAPLLSQLAGEQYTVVALVCVALAFVGFLTSLRIKRTPPAGVKIKGHPFFLTQVIRTLRKIKSDKYLLLAVIGSAYFLLIGGYIYSNLIPYGIGHLGLTKVQSGYLFVIAAMGISLGALLAGKLSGRNVEFGVVPLGALGLTLGSVGLGVLPFGLYRTFVLVFLMGLSAGLFVVPIHAFIQIRSDKHIRGEVLATSSFLGWLGVLIASGLIYLLSGVWGLSAAKVFVVLGLMTLVPTLFTILLLPDFLVRFVGMIITRCVYRIKVHGLENVPTQGGVLLVSNHVSWVDAVLLGAASRRRIRFIMDKSFYNKPLLKPFCRLMKVIPVSSSDTPKELLKSLRNARKAMDDGYIVCIFAEGAVTRTGMMMRFKGGFKRILKGTDYKILPVYIGGVWGSIFSYYSGKILASVPRRFPYPISIHFGKCIDPVSSVAQIRLKVAELSGEYFEGLKGRNRSLILHFIKAARKNWHRRCINDTTGRKLNFGQALTGMVALSKCLKSLTNDDKMVGVLLPPTVGAALINTALTYLGKIGVNLNYSSSEKVISQSIQQCGIQHVVTSKKFLEKINISEQVPGQLVFVEDLIEGISRADKFKAFLAARFLPGKMLLGRRFRADDDLATVIFSSGSTGVPKGIMLSHHNIISNIEAMRMVVKLTPEDNLSGSLPFFHSFGYTCGLWFGLISGISVSYIPNPLDIKAIGRSISQNKSTIAIAPPTFLMNYLRRIDAENLLSLRLVVAGAEKLTDKLADAFEEKFGIRPFEGYGAIFPMFRPMVFTR